MDKAQLVNHLSDLEKSLFEAKETIHAEKKHNKTEVDAKIENEMRKIVDGRMKNDPMNSLTSGAGEELVPDVMTSTSLIDRGVTNKRFAMLQPLSAGRHMEDLGQTTDLPIIWTVPDAAVYGEWTTGTYGQLNPQKIAPTDKVTLAMKQVACQTGVSKELEMYGIVSALNKISEKFSFSVSSAVMDSLLNGDTLEAATGNINSDDQLASTTFPAQADGWVPIIRSCDDGLRKQPLNGVLDTDYIDLGGSAIAVEDIYEAAGKMRFDSAPDDRFIAMDNRTFYELMADDGYQDQSKNGVASTLTTGALGSVLGMEIFVSDKYKLAEADGKLSGATPANNVLGSFLIAEKNVMQWGFSGAPTTVVQRTDLLKGFVFQGYVMFGQANINKTALETNPSIVMWINIG